MSELKELKEKLKAHWQKTKEERERTHTKAIYDKLLKNRKEND